MSKKAFPINRVNIDPPKPVRVAPNPPIALPEREPRNIWVMIGVPALIVALIGTIVMLYVSGVRSLATGSSADGHRRVQHAGVLRTIRSSPQDHLG